MAKLHLYDRIVIYQRRSGWVCDLGAGHVLTPRLNNGEEYFDTGAGTRKAIARSRELIIPVFNDDKIRYLRTMWKEGCEIRALLIGKGSHMVWDLDSAFNLVDFGGEIGGVSGANIIMNTDVYVGSVYQGEDLLSGIPWECESSEEISGVNYFPGPAGWQGNRYVVTSGDSVDEDGLFAGSGDPQLTMYCPLEGASLKIAGSFIGNVVTRDYSGTALTTTNKTLNGTDVDFTVDTGTWTLEVNVNSSNARPQLIVNSSGSLASNRPGGCIDCSDLAATASTAPDWTS